MSTTNRPMPPPPRWELALLKMFVETPEEILSALEAHNAVRAFTHPGVQVAIDAGVSALRSGKAFDGPLALEAALSAGLDEATVAVFRRSLMESLPHRDDITTCVKSLMRNRHTISVQQLRQRLAKETEQGAAERIVTEIDRLNKAMASLI